MTGAALATFAVAAPCFGQDGNVPHAQEKEASAESPKPNLRIGVVGCGGRGIAQRASGIASATKACRSLTIS